ncbi:hypothetical protein Bca4012_083666 [Brassica carinata]
MPSICRFLHSTVQSSVANGSAPAAVAVERDQIRLGLPSKRRMAADSINLLKCSSGEVTLRRFGLSEYGQMSYSFFFWCVATGHL